MSGAAAPLTGTCREAVVAGGPGDRCSLLLMIGSSAVDTTLRPEAREAGLCDGESVWEPGGADTDVDDWLD